MGISRCLSFRTCSVPIVLYVCVVLVALWLMKIIFLFLLVVAHLLMLSFMSFTTS